MSLLIFFLYFHPGAMFVSVSRMGFYKQQIVGSSYLIQFVNQCLFMGKLSPLTFSVNVERYVLILAI
jgi:hypothetical protein